jgi:Rrf2 family protein
MRIGEGAEWSIHSCVLLAALPEGRALPAARVAEFHGVPAAYLAKHLQALAQAGVVEAVAGRNGGYRLARPAQEITLLDVVQAVEGASPAFRCTEIRQRGPISAPRREFRATCGVASAMWAAERAWRESLAGRTVFDLLVEVAETVSPVSIRKTASWLEEAMR